VGGTQSRGTRRAMADDERNSPIASSSKSLQDNVTRSGSVIAASYTLVGGILLLGGIGYAVDYWRGTQPWFLLGGLTLGIVLGFYELVKTVSKK
jgi:ATP synthase protein I